MEQDINYQGCDICGGDHDTEICPELGLGVEETSQQLLSKARLTLPHSLSAIDGEDGSVVVVAKEKIPAKTKFGPFEARKTTADIVIDNGFVLKIFGKDGMVVSLDTSEEQECNWMCLVPTAQDADTQNCMAFQLGTDIYFSTLKEVPVLGQLRVWYAPHYAKKLGKPAQPDGSFQSLLGMQLLQVSTPITPVPVTPSKAAGDVQIVHVFTCPNCSEKFNSWQLFQTHLSTHDTPKQDTVASMKVKEEAVDDDRDVYYQGPQEAELPNKCRECKQQFETEYALAAHLKKHIEKIVYPHQENQKQTSEVQEPIVRRKRGRPRKTPPVVDLDIAPTPDIDLDPKSQPAPPSTPLLSGRTKCEFCALYFSRHATMQKHLREKHSRPADENVPEVKVKVKVKKETRGRKRKRKITDDVSHVESEEVETAGGEENGASKSAGDEEFPNGEMEKGVDDGVDPDFEPQKKACLQENQESPESYTLKEHYFRLEMEGIVYFKCKHCSFTHTEERKMNSHCAVHTDLHCFECRLTVSKKEDLMEHQCNETLKDSKSDEDLYSVVDPTIDHCTKREQDGVEVFTCNDCDEKFESMEAFLEHYIVHIPQYFCAKCLRSFEEEVVLKKHNCCEKGKIILRPEVDLAEEYTTIEKDGKTLYRCKRCSYKTNAMSNFRRHIDLHLDRFKCEKCMRCFSRKDSLMIHIKNNSCKRNTSKYEVPGGFRCSVCDKVLVNKASFILHLEGHDQINQCPHCEKKFTRKISLEHHVPMCMKAQTKKYHQCQLCPAVFGKAKYLLRHMDAHTGQHTCKRCGKNFSRKESLAIHVVKCDPLCEDNTDFDKSNLFPCPLCPKVLFRQITYENHMKKHKNVSWSMCDKCEQWFGDPATLTAHYVSCAGENAFTCDKCEIAFEAEGEFRKHIVEHSENYTCHVCTKDFTREDLVRHLCECEGAVMEELGGLLKCPACEKEFRDPSEFAEHACDGHMFTYTCNKCGLQYLFRQGYEVHTKQCNGAQENAKLKCPICDLKFSTQQALTSHTFEHRESGFECGDCGKTFTRRDYSNFHTCRRSDGSCVRIKLKSGEHMVLPQLVCHLCGKSFVNTTNLNRHILTHGQKSIPCDLCGKMFTHMYAMKDHRKQVHSSGYLFQCYKCGKLLKNKNSLGSHLKMMHSEDNDGYKYHCMECGKSFRQKGNLKKHKLSHIKARNFTCTVCDKAFKYPEQLSRHIRGHDPGGLKYPCDKCDRAFVVKSDLLRHQALHSGSVYRCEYCSTECRYYHTMTRHIRRRHPERVKRGKEQIKYIKSLLSVSKNQNPPANHSAAQIVKEEIVLKQSSILDTVEYDLQSLQGDALVSQEVAEALRTLSGTAMTSTHIEGATAQGQVIDLSAIPGLGSVNISVVKDGHYVIVPMTNQGQEEEISVTVATS